ncbi:MAG TPA: hypothetical protein VHC39_18235 [Rhizomicrobium sp.]|nr:hypothetical protein [Rhizomicrobium sp.]
MRIVFATSVLVLLLGSAASARPRDEVMINVYRCAGHAATRVWLDCYYGAAQPQRAALGLTPAPPAQVALVTTPSAPGVPQDMVARDAVIAAAARCGSVSAERPWLDCYYAAANPVRRLLGLSPVSVPMPLPDPAAHKNDGFMGGVFARPEVKASGRMASYKFDRNGFFTVMLDDGQVWRQLDGDTSLAHWFRKPGNYVVTITSGALGSFNLRVKGEAASYKVRQVPP